MLGALFGCKRRGADNQVTSLYLVVKVAISGTEIGTSGATYALSYERNDWVSEFSDSAESNNRAGTSNVFASSFFFVLIQVTRVLTQGSSAVVEPVEFIRTVDLIRYYAAKFKGKGGAATSTAAEAGQVVQYLAKAKSEKRRRSGAV